MKLSHHCLRWASLLLLDVQGLAGLAHAADGKEVPLRFGFGCEFSDYAALSTSSGSDVPSFRLLHDSGLGKGVFTLHFASFNLPDDDFVLLRGKNVDKSSPDAQVLAGGNSTGSFFSSPVVGEGLIFELYRQKTQSKSSSASASASQACLGVEVSGMIFTAEKQAEVAQEKQLALGLPRVDGSASKAEQAITPASNSKKVQKPNEDKDNESLCGVDESKEAACLESSGEAMQKVMYNKSQAVARLTIRKDNNLNTAYCTGFLLGCEGHLITNQHCIGNWLDALNTYIEFFAEASTCGSTDCAVRGSCPGRVRAGNATLTAVSTDLDYALIKISRGDGKSDIPSLFAQVGGYLQLRASGPKLQEEIYIPQHPLGQGKRIAWTASGKPGRIESLTAGECGGGDAGYYVDTNEGSSGSPVIATSDNAVVALHHCGGCLNGGIPSQKLIADLETKGVLPRCAIAP
ncbi:Serine protease v8 [Globisporangium polare]